MTKRTFAVDLNNKTGCLLIKWLEDNIGKLDYDKTKSNSLDPISDERLHDHNILIGEGKRIFGKGWMIRTANENLSMEKHAYSELMPYKVKFTKRNINEEAMVHFLLRWA